MIRICFSAFLSAKAARPGTASRGKGLPCLIGIFQKLMDMEVPISPCLFKMSEL